MPYLSDGYGSPFLCHYYSDLEKVLLAIVVLSQVLPSKVSQRPFKANLWVMTGFSGLRKRIHGPLVSWQTRRSCIILTAGTEDHGPDPDSWGLFIVLRSSPVFVFDGGPSL